MIREIIEFAEQIPDEVKHASKQKIRIVPVIVINTDINNEELEFLGIRILNNSEEISNFLANVSDLKEKFKWTSPEKFIGWLTKQINLRSGNKRLGSTQGLLTSVPYTFKLSDKVISKFKKRAERLKNPRRERWKTYPEIQSRITENLRKIYSENFSEFLKNKSNISESSIVFVLFPEEIFRIKRKEIYEAFSKDRSEEWENIKFCSSSELVCPICGKPAKLGPPRTYTYQEGKPFLSHLTRPDENGIGFRICKECETNFDKALNKIKNAGFRIFPIFAKSDVPEGMKFYDGEKDRAKSFKEIFEEMRELAREKSSERYKFHLVALGDDYFRLYDYIVGYSPFFENTSCNSRFEVEWLVWSLLGMPSASEVNYPYFEENVTKMKWAKSLSPKRRQLILSMREKIFNFTYRGDDSALSKEDISKIFVALVEDELVNNANSDRLCKQAVEDINKLLNLNVLRWSKMVEINEQDKENAKILGKVTRKLVSFSEAKNKSLLLGLIIDKPFIEGERGVKNALVRLIEKYRHKIDELNPQERKLIHDALGAKFSIKRFEPLKVYFYIGYFE